MRVLSRAPTPVLNVEAYHLLKHRYLQASLGEGLPLPPSQQELERQLKYYLKGLVSGVSQQDFRVLWKAFSPENGFSSMERLQVINDPPQSAAELAAAVQDLQGRFSPEAIAHLVELCVSCSSRERGGAEEPAGAPAEVGGIGGTSGTDAAAR